MRSDKLQDAIGMIDSELIARSEKIPPAVRFRKQSKWLAPLAALLVLVIGFHLFAPFGKDKDASGSLWNPLAIPVSSLAIAEYPKAPSFPMGDPYSLEYLKAEKAWDQFQLRYKDYLGNGAALTPFFENTIAQFLVSDSKENRIYSPSNAYLSLAILAELTGGETQRQILDLLGAESMEALRAQANDVWNVNYVDNERGTCTNASSLWLDTNVSFDQAVLNTLAQNYYASSYQGDLSSEEFQTSLNDWLSKETHGVLTEHDPFRDKKEGSANLLALMTTLYYDMNWSFDFDEKSTYSGTFHGANGDASCQFMYDKEAFGCYYLGSGFSAVSKALANGGTMYFILPDEGSSVEALLKNPEAISFLANPEAQTGTQGYIRLTVPKLKIFSQMDLSEGLKALGVTDCFQGGVADFPSFTLKEAIDGLGPYVPSIPHDVSFSMKETGITAASVTSIPAVMDGTPNVLCTFTVDRPFLFVLMGRDQIPLFTGVIQTP